MKRKLVLFWTLLLVSTLFIRVFASEPAFVIDQLEVEIDIDNASFVRITQNMAAHMENHAAEFTLGYPIRWNDDRWIVLEEEEVFSSNATTLKRHQKGERIVLDYFANYQQRMGAPFTLAHKLGYNLGVDLYSDKDDLKLLIADDFWQATTHQLEFVIRLPYEITADQITFETNAGNTSDVLEYALQGNVISGVTKTTLQAGQSIYLSLALPEGYFTHATALVFPGQTPAAIGPYLLALALGLAVALWFFLARNRKPITDLIPQIPFHLTSAEMGYLFDHSLDQTDTASLLLCWAQQGALKFIEDKQTTLINPATFFSLEKTGDLTNQAKPYEQTMFEILFSRFGKDGKVTDSVLENRFYLHTEEGEKGIKDQVNVLNPFGVYEGYNKYLRAFFLLLAWASGYYALLLLSLDIFQLQGWLMQIISVSISALLTLVVYLSAFFLNLYLVARDRTKLGLAIVMLLTVGGAFGFLLFTTWKGKFFFPILLGLITFFLLAFLAGNTNKRTKFGEEISEKILGFRRFLTEASSEELQLRVNNQPSLFFEYLPFAFVLGVQRAWARKFNDFSLTQPTWYESNVPFLTAFNAYDFTLRIEKTMARLTEVLFSAPAINTKGSIAPNTIEVKKIGNSWKIRY